jgi:hypothetical protein
MRATWPVVVIAFLAAACPMPPPPPTIGGPCTTGTGAGPTGTITISRPALDCEGDLCVQTGDAASGACSAHCASDADCREVGPGATACATGFTCAPATALGELACQKLCLCRDSASLWEPAGAACSSVQPR